MKKIKKSVSFSGGAEAGVLYFPEMISQYNNKPRFDGKYVIYTSAGAVTHVPLHCGNSPQMIAEMLCALTGDEYMKEQPTNPLKAIKWASKIKNTLNKDAIRLSKQFTWDSMEKSGYFGKAKPMISVCKACDVVRVLGKDLVNGIGDGSITSPQKEIINGDPEKLQKYAEIFYFSWDGTYKYDFKTGKIIKVSKKVAKLSDVYMASWTNSRLLGQINRLPFDRIIRRRGFDQGIFSNKGCLVDDEVLSISCTPYPSTYENKGLLSISNYNYLYKPANEEVEMKRLDNDVNIPFFGFWNERIMRYYYHGLETSEDYDYLFKD